MKLKLFVSLVLVLSFVCAASGQGPMEVHVKILKAEDARRWDGELEKLISGNAAEPVVVRAMLAAGRIGDERAVPVLSQRLRSGSPNVAAMAAFALGEIESISAADAISQRIGETGSAKGTFNNRGRLAEAAGKIAAANAKHEKAKQLSDAIVFVLAAEKENPTSVETIRLALTAALRARPAGAEENVRFFLSHTDPGVVADALNTLARMRAKNANRDARDLLETHTHAVVRANAARVLGAAEDKEAVDLLIKAATSDPDSRVRVSAIRALASLKDPRAVDRLIAATGPMLVETKTRRSGELKHKNELLEIATALGRILENTEDVRASRFLSSLRLADGYSSPETEIAFARASPKAYVQLPTFVPPRDSGFLMGAGGALAASLYLTQYQRAIGNFAQGHAVIAESKAVDEATLKKSRDYVELLMVGVPAVTILSNAAAAEVEQGKERNRPEWPAAKKSSEEFHRTMVNAFPDVLRAYAKFKSEGYEMRIGEFLLNEPVVVASNDGKKYALVIEASEQEKREGKADLIKKDPIVRATAAEITGEIKNVVWSPALRKAFDYAVANDTTMNDAQLAILDAIAKEKDSSNKPAFEKALASPDAIVRDRAATLITQNDHLKAAFPNVKKEITPLKSHTKEILTRNGQLLNTDADYSRAISRKNGSVRAMLTTEKGEFAIDLLPEDAPLTVDNFVKLARSGYFNGLEVHRVVPNFVMQDGDPRGDGNGGPGWSIRCEINMIPFERGAVGMALSGKDTGGSQWFVTHSPQPHLDGGYTVFGRVNEKDMAVVDKIARGDKIVSVRIVEDAAARAGRK